MFLFLFIAKRIDQYEANRFDCVTGVRRGHEGKVLRWPPCAPFFGSVKLIMCGWWGERDNARPRHCLAMNFSSYTYVKVMQQKFIEHKYIAYSI